MSLERWLLMSLVSDTAVCVVLILTWALIAYCLLKLDK